MNFLEDVKDNDGNPGFTVVVAAIGFDYLSGSESVSIMANSAGAKLQVAGYDVSDAFAIKV